MDSWIKLVMIWSEKLGYIHCKKSKDIFKRLASWNESTVWGVQSGDRTKPIAVPWCSDWQPYCNSCSQEGWLIYSCMDGWPLTQGPGIPAKPSNHSLLTQDSWCIHCYIICELLSVNFETVKDIAILILGLFSNPLVCFQINYCGKFYWCKNITLVGFNMPFNKTNNLPLMTFLKMNRKFADIE